LSGSGSRGSLTLPAGPTATQAGDIAAGAKIEARTIETVLPIPAGSTVTLTPPPRPDAPAPTTAITLAAASTLTTRETRQEATGATSHAPPAPPTPAQIAAGQGVRVFYYLAAALGLAALAAFYFGHGKAAVLCVIGAACLPLLASVSATLASHTAVAVAVAAAALVAAWFLVRNRLQKTQENTQ
jgi:hypothetical protein